jgi:predicted AAA+ superfamily ATPase
METELTPEPSPVFAWVKRHLTPLVQEALTDTPAVLINGPRQCGKTTLVKQFGQAMSYFTLDDPAVLAAVLQDPVGFVKQLDRAIIDEIQRAPQLLLALKLAIDQDRRPGRFLLTGSANLMTLPQVADSLAGRIELLNLLPLSNSELQGRPNDFIKRAVQNSWPLTHPSWQTPGSDTVAHVLAGGYPEMRQRTTAARRQAWAKSYVQTLVERDVRDVAQIEHLSQIPHLLAVAAAYCGNLFNGAQIGGQLNLNTKTVDKYLGILEKLFLIQRLPAWSRNEISRLIKAPKLHFLDAGLQSTLVRLNQELVFKQRERWGATLETWVYAELRKTLALDSGQWHLSHFRDKDQIEVDFVLESPLRQVMGIEVKAAASVQFSDFKGLQKLKTLAGQDFITGLVLYDGEQALSFGNGLWAVPLAAL